MVPHKVGETARGVYWRKGPLQEGMLTCPGDGLLNAKSRFQKDVWLGEGSLHIS